MPVPRLLIAMVSLGLSLPVAAACPASPDSESMGGGMMEMGGMDGMSMMDMPMMQRHMEEMEAHMKQMREIKDPDARMDAMASHMEEMQDHMNMMRHMMKMMHGNGMTKDGHQGEEKGKTGAKD